MKVLWLCNIMLPLVAGHLGLEASNKEGWLSGLADLVLAQGEGSGIRLSVAFPVALPKSAFLRGGAAGKAIEKEAVVPEEGASGILCSGTVAQGKGRLDYYGFSEDTSHPERYAPELEPVMKAIIDRVQPDIVHCFGTEYPHILAMCRTFSDRRRLLVGLQGLCTMLARAYYADLPAKAVESVTFRDWLKEDGIEQQRGKFAKRGAMEREAVRLAGNVAGRTRWDRDCAEAWNPKVRYHFMNESLRREFYGPVWAEEKCVPHSIVLSQGDYPIKGLHYMLQALPEILAEYPDAKVYVAGNSLVRHETFMEKVKISGYGKYLRRQIAEMHLEDKVVFLGRLDAGQMRDRYLQSHLYVCCSALENSPNSLGEAMLLGMPCVAADVGGIPSIFEGGADGIMYRGFRVKSGEGEEADGRGAHGCDSPAGQEEELCAVAGRLARSVLQMWADPEKRRQYCGNARLHALQTHDRDKNYRRLVEIYEEIL